MSNSRLSRIQMAGRKRPGRPFSVAMWNSWLTSAPWAQTPEDARTLRLREGIQDMRARLAGGGQ